MSKNQRFAKYGPWVVITGASSGIGRAIAVELARNNVKCVLVARSKTELEKLAEEIGGQFQSECRVLVLDLAEHGAADTLARATEDLDVGLLVASAGFGTSGSFLDNSIDTELKMLSVNCRSLMELSWMFGRRFARRGRGGIILLSSIVAFQGTPWSSHYSATKAYVQVLAEGLYTELKEKKVDVLAVAPGPTNTGFASRANMKMGATLDPVELAPQILNALGRKRTVFPGFLSKLLVYSMTPLPRWARILIMGKVMSGMAINK